jgi:hypothetical protein
LGNRNELSPEELKLFFEFKALFLSEMKYSHKADISDHYLLRFLRAKDFSLKEGKLYLQEHLSWRE